MIFSRRFSQNQQLQHAAANSPPLQVGSTGKGVAELQDALCDLGFALTKTFATGRADGIYGSETEKAVSAFQQRHGLKADGIAGTLTIEKLDGIIVTSRGLDAPCPIKTSASDSADRSRPLHKRMKANW